MRLLSGRSARLGSATPSLPAVPLSSDDATRACIEPMSGNENCCIFTSPMPTFSSQPLLPYLSLTTVHLCVSSGIVALLVGVLFRKCGPLISWESYTTQRVVPSLLVSAQPVCPAGADTAPFPRPIITAQHPLWLFSSPLLARECHKSYSNDGEVSLHGIRISSQTRDCPFRLE